MSGRGRGSFAGGRGRGRKGHRESKQGASGEVKKKERKTLADYVFYIGSSKQESEYAKISQFILNHVQKEFDYGDDIADALENEVEWNETPHLPVLKVIPKEEEGDQKRSTEEREALEKANFTFYQYEVQEFIKRRKAYQTNKGKAYALIYG